MQNSTRNKFKRYSIAIIIMVAILLFASLGFVTVSYMTTTLDVEALNSSSLGIEIYSETNSEATSNAVSYSFDKKIISYSNLQPHTLNAFIAIEDKRFYEHNGYDLKRIAKASLVNLKNGSKSQGASTITQQLVKNILLNSEKTYSRKFKEILLAIKTEKNFTKDEILNMYLNSIYFGSDAYGIESASNLYFNKSASELDINESAILAGIIKSPAYYSPINHPDNCFNRKNLVLEQMYKNGYISLEQYNANKEKSIQVSSHKNTYDNSYNQQAILEACDLLNITEKELLRQQLRIYTYLDNDIQQYLQQSLDNSSFIADKLAMVADNNGRVLAYCGDSRYNLSQMHRNPASTIKPLLLYLPAIASNMISPATPILDEPLQQDYSPKNAGDNYLGWISIREALAHSSNVCAVKLLEQIGLPTLNEYAYKLNLTNTYHSNPSIALGNINNGVKIIDLARAYAVLQNNGVDKGLTFISRIENKDGKILYQNKGYSNTLFKAEDCMLVNDMLKTCTSIGTAKRLNDLPFEVASKTGTAQNNGKNTDLWNVAYTTEYLTLCWCGDATSNGLDANFSSGFYPTLINKNILSNIHSKNIPKPFKFNNNIVKVALDSIEYNELHQLSNASENASERYIFYDYFKADNLPNQQSSTHQAPNFNLTAELTTKGTLIKLETNPLFKYEIFRNVNQNPTSLGIYSDENQLIDDKVFKYDCVEYYAVATNNYTQQKFNSEKVCLYPEEFLINHLNQQFVQQNRNTKTRWYI